MVTCPASVQVQVCVEGRAVSNSPFTVQLQPGPVCLEGLQVTGATAPCFAGQEQSITIVTLDSCNNETASDGSAQIVVNVASQEGQVKGETRMQHACPSSCAH